MKIKNIDVLCVFGRGIEKDENDVWQPTAYLEELTPDNQHSGQRKQGLGLDSENSRVVVAGAYANVMAATHIWKTLSSGKGKYPNVIVFAAGRPKYLQDEPEERVWEGSPLYRVMSENCGDLASRSQIIFQRNNLNTRDDLLETLKMTRSRQLRQVAIISVLVHLRRIAEFLRHALIEEPSFAEINTILYASELVLVGNGRVKDLLLLEDPGVDDQLDHLVMARIIESPVFRRTTAREESGIKDLREGRYNFDHQGYQFAK